MNYVSESVTHVIADDPNDFQVSDGEIYDKVSVTVGSAANCLLNESSLKRIVFRIRRFEISLFHQSKPMNFNPEFRL